MKNSVIGLVFLTSLACAQNAEKAAPAPPPQGNTEIPKPAGTLRRLESLTWNPMQLELSWVVSVWDLANTEAPRDLERYIIHMDTKQMELNGKAHSFEAADQNLSEVLDLISAFSMKSTAWWGNAERGTGGADRNEPPAGSDQKDDKKDKPKDPAQKGQPTPKEQPSPKPPVTGKIAQNDAAPSVTTQTGAAHDPLY